MSSVVTPPVPYTTDEYIYSLSSMDFLSLVPTSNVWAYGEDGTIGTADPWALQSATNDFATAAVIPKMLIQFMAPKTVYGNAGQIYAVDSVDATDPTVLHTRRVAAPPFSGTPPGTISGIMDVTFQLPTLRPQIDVAGRWIDSEYRIGYDAGRLRSDLIPQDLDRLEMLCAAIVLRDQYIAMASSMNEIGAGKSTFAAKGKEWDTRVVAMAGVFRPHFATPEPNLSPRRTGMLFRI